MKSKEQIEEKLKEVDQIPASKGFEKNRAVNRGAVYGWGEALKIGRASCRERV